MNEDVREIVARELTGRTLLCFSFMENAAVPAHKAKEWTDAILAALADKGYVVVGDCQYCGVVHYPPCAPIPERGE